MAKKPVKKRLMNPSLIKIAVVAILAPTLTSLGIDYEDITSWQKLISVLTALILNPYLLGTTVVGFLIFLMDNKEEEEPEEKEKINEEDK